MGHEQKTSRAKMTDEEIALRQQQLRRQAQQRLAQAGGTQRTSASRPSRASASRSESNGVAIAALVLSLVSLVGAGFLFIHLQSATQKLNDAQLVIDDQSAQLAAVNERLSMSGENANLSVDALKILMREQELEIKELWDLASKRNRTDIDNITKQLSSLETGSSVDSRVKSQLRSLTKKVDSLVSGERDLASKHSVLMSRVSNLENLKGSLSAQSGLGVEQNKESINMMNASLASLRQTVEKMRSTGGYGELADMKLEMEDVQIRLDRIQNALGGSAPR